MMIQEDNSEACQSLEEEAANDDAWQCEGVHANIATPEVPWRSSTKASNALFGKLDMKGPSAHRPKPRTGPRYKPPPSA